MQRTVTSGRDARQPTPATPATPRAPWLRLLPEDGWMTIVLVALVVFVTVYSVQTVTPAWAPGLGILASTSAVGLLLGYLAAEQGRLPDGLVHAVAVALGLAFAVWETARADFAGNVRALLAHVGSWLGRGVFTPGNQADNEVFLLLLSVLTCLLAYMSLWLVVRARRPWLALLANAVVLLVNLGSAPADRYFFLLLFLLAAFMLLVRFALAEHTRRWTARGLRFSPDLRWDVMQAGAIFSVVVLLLAYLLPALNANAAIYKAFNSPNSPIVRLEGELQSIFGGVSGGSGGGGVGQFGGGLTLVGTVNLPDTPVLHYTAAGSTGDPTQYLITTTYDTYNGQNQWLESQSQDTTLGGGEVEPPSSPTSTTDTYSITLINVPTGGEYNLFTPGSSAASFNVPAIVAVGEQSRMPVSYRARAPLLAGQSYIAQGYVSAATDSQLKAVAYPSDLSPQDQASQYPAVVLNQYLNPQGNIPPAVAKLAQQWTQGATSMYAAAQMIEQHLRQFTYSTQNPDPPANVDATTWFLQRQEGYCTFFASAMALMGRALGMPTRVVSGYIDGTFDSNQGYYVVKGTAAHTWTQVYFGSYGWINFEPTSTFTTFTRATASTGAATPTGPQPTVTSAAGRTSVPNGGRSAPDVTPGVGGTAVRGAGLAVGVLLLLLGLAALVLLTWWRLAFRRLSAPASALARITRLGTWAGAPPQRDQTPREYAARLAALIPDQQVALDAITETYSLERWSGVLAPGEAPAVDVEALYDSVRRALWSVIAQRARTAPRSLLDNARHGFRHRVRDQRA